MYGSEGNRVRKPISTSFRLSIMIVEETVDFSCAAKSESPSPSSAKLL